MRRSPDAESAFTVNAAASSGEVGFRIFARALVPVVVLARASLALDLASRLFFAGRALLLAHRLIALIRAGLFPLLHLLVGNNGLIALGLAAGFEALFTRHGRWSLQRVCRVFCPLAPGMARASQSRRRLSSHGGPDAYERFEYLARAR